MTKCQHENVEFEGGNYVPPFGWEIYPGYYCLDCGQMMSDEEVGVGEPDPDLEYKARKEAESW